MDVGSIVRLSKAILGRKDLDEQTRIHLAESALTLFDEPDTIVQEEPAESNRFGESPRPSIEEVADSDLPNDLLHPKEIGQIFGYSEVAAYNWSDRYPDRVRRYRTNGGIMFSRAEVEWYVSTHGKQARAEQRAAKEELSTPRVISTTNRVAESPRWEMKATPSERTGVGAIEEWDTVVGLARRTRKGVHLIRSYIESGRLQTRDFYGRQIASARQLEAIDGKPPQKYDPPWHIFEANKWLPITDAVQALGIEQHPTLTRQVSEACTQAKIANRQIGGLRFVCVADLERWYLSR